MAAADVSHGEPRKFKLRWVQVAVTMVPLLAIITVGLAYLNSPRIIFSCFSCPILEVNKVSFGSAPGQVTFLITNSGSQDQTIAQVVTGQSKYSYNATVSTNTLVHPRANSSLTVTFPNTTFQIGRTYNFTFVTSQGAWFPISTIR